MKLQYFSDLHLEFGDLSLEQTDADVAIAAGDIGVGLEGMRWLTGFDKPVIYVLGNHEYWGQDYTDFIDQVWQESSGTNVYFLENESVIIDDVRFVGCSLWTDYGYENAQIMDVALGGMNDFRYISDNGAPLEPIRLLETHRQSVNWLTEVLEQPFKGKTVVVTHHAPSMKSWHRGITDSYRFCYCSDLENLLLSTRPDLWVHGHTHHTQDYTVNGVRILCNPRGYFNHQEVNGFVLGRSVEI